MKKFKHPTVEIVDFVKDEIIACSGPDGINFNSSETHDVKGDSADETH